jgi:hypothetical protein
MSASSPASASVKTWDSLEWDRLLLLVEAGAVVPILGPEISRLGTVEALPVAQAVADSLGLPAEGLSPDRPLNDLALRQIRSAGSAQDVYLGLYQVLQKHPLPPSESQRRLAEITDIQFFLTTGFDFSIETALREARGVEVQSLAYAPNDVQDLATGIKG